MKELGSPLEIVFTVIFSAAAFPFWISIAFALLTKHVLLHPLLQLFVAWFFISGVPTAILVYCYKKGWSDINFSDRFERRWFYAVVILSYLTAVILFDIFSAHDFYYLACCYVTVTTAVMLVNWFWKISAHTAGTAGPITAAVLAFGYYLSPLYVIPVILVFLRYKQKAHSYAQLAAGFALSMLVTYLTFLAVY